MFTKPSQVLIGTEVNIADWKKLTAGQITVVDENFKPATAPANAKSLYIGVCTGEDENGNKIVKWSDRIQKASKPAYAVNAAEDPAPATIEIDLSGVTPVVGHRYVLRVLYKDMNIANFQFTHTGRNIQRIEEDHTFRNIPE